MKHNSWPGNDNLHACWQPEKKWTLYNLMEHSQAEAHQWTSEVGMKNSQFWRRHHMGFLTTDPRRDFARNASQSTCRLTSYNAFSWCIIWLPNRDITNESAAARLVGFLMITGWFAGILISQLFPAFWWWWLGSGKKKVFGSFFLPPFFGG